MNLQYRPISADLLEDYFKATTVPFAFDFNEAGFERFSKVFEMPRMRAAFDGDSIVGTFATHSLQLTVPGGVVPTGGTSVVTVLPTHRRRGILRMMMTEHLREAYENGELLAGLWASESNIYGRFGYGPATDRILAKLEKPYAVMKHPVNIDDSLRIVDREEALELFSPLYEEIRATRPGMFSRREAWWRHRFLSDVENLRGGATAYRYIVHMRDDKPVGYLVFRVKAASVFAANTALIQELLAIDPAAEKALWQFVFGLDLVSEISCWNLPTDTPLRWWLADPRRMERIVQDGLWIRVVKVDAALSQRKYSAAGKVTFSIEDEQCPWNDGNYSLEVDQDGNGHCQRTNDEAAVQLTPFSLGSTYLGGPRFCELARAEIISGDFQSIEKLDAMFAWNQAPWCQEIF
jgi:predicted acetyltransferase